MLTVVKQRLEEAGMKLAADALGKLGVAADHLTKLKDADRTAEIDQLTGAGWMFDA